MSFGTFLAFVTFLSIGIVFHRQRADHQTTVHYPAPNIHPYDPLTNSGYTIGNYSKHPKQGLLLTQMVRYKKINNYIFVHYNLYKAELTFVDLGYASVFHFTMFGESTYFTMEENLGFELDTNGFNGMNYQFIKKDFNLTVRQRVDEQSHETITTFNLTVKRASSKVEANLVHIMRNEQCFSATRGSNILSHKCYGGYGSGGISIQYQDFAEGKKKFSAYHLSNNLTRSAFDGLRGAGFHWKYVWAMGSGFNKQEFYDHNHTIAQNRWIGINFGSLSGQGQDFIFWSGQIIPVHNLQYQFNQNTNQHQNITFTATEPPMRLVFTVFHSPRIFKDMGIIKINMIKFEGYWSGWIEVEGKKNQFKEVAGLVESSDSLF